MAAINGVCHAGGLDIALHCDVTIASDRARFRIPELLRGLPDPFMPERLVAAVGLARAKYLFFTASELTAAEARAGPHSAPSRCICGTMPDVETVMRRWLSPNPSGSARRRIAPTVVA